MRVWFNRHLSVVIPVTGLLRKAQFPVTAIISHRHSYFSGFITADESFVEPNGLSSDDYTAWCLETARQHRVDWLVPGHEAAALAAAEPRFNAIGVRMVNAANADLVPLLHQKDWVYANAPASVPKPQFVVVDAKADVEAALALIEQSGPACIKPCVSIYGHGYHRLCSPVFSAISLSAGEQADPQILDLSAWHARYSALSLERRQLVMEYLPGCEYSVDLACFQGELLAGVSRRKSLTSPVQTIVDRADLIEFSSQLVAAFGLHGLINVQFKDALDGSPKLLEINPRASGGIAMSCLSGLNLPLIAYQACLQDGKRTTLSAPIYGLRVAEIPSAIVVPAWAPQ